MASDLVVPAGDDEGPFTNPWPALITGVAATATAFVLTAWLPALMGSWANLRIVLLVPGLLAAAAAIVIRPRSPVVLAVAALVALLASVAISEPVTDKTENAKAFETPWTVSFLTAQGQTVEATAGVICSDVVATFEETGDAGLRRYYVATVAWGDGLTSEAKVERPPHSKNFTVTGAHQYADEGVYNVRVSIVDQDNDKHKAEQLASVASVARVAGWDSGRLLLRVLAAVAGACAVVVLLPRVAQRAVVSFVILFHFGGILSAVTNVPPAPWISAQLWNCVYRPYLQFLYMNNAYHYYAPDPGPASMLWFRIEYEKTYERTPDNKHWRWVNNWQWVRTPDVSEDGELLRPDGTPFRLHVQYTRRLSLSESVNQQNPVANFGYFRDEIRPKRADIPFHPYVPIDNQYKEPPPQSKRWLESYVRYVARHFPHDERPELKVTGIKVYLVIHNMLEPYQVATRTPQNGAGETDPTERFLYWPFYQGEFDTDGRLKPSSRKVSFDAQGHEQEVSRDPLLYWLIPIYLKLKPAQRRLVRKHPEKLREMTREDYDLKDFLAFQSGDVAEEPQP
ncbi:MAG TPA: hypothetical protein VG013_05470 [Gemmataceae bacterium]|jgi:hypothetical protein|nr:hypothetical protein [Gemmataceae bacterium]